MADFELAYAPVKKWEGGYCNVSGDSGGETYAGVARNFFPDWGGWRIIDTEKKHKSFATSHKAFSKHLESFEALSTLVMQFYRVEFWEKMKLDVYPQSLAAEIFEQAINLGMGQVGKNLQRACNAFNQDKIGQAFFKDLAIDGVMGRKTHEALDILLHKKINSTKLVHVLNGLQIAHYISLGAKNTHHRKFVSGWLTRT